MERAWNKQYMISTQKLKREKILTTTCKDEVEEYFIFKTSRQNFMYTFYHTNMDEFDGNLELLFDEGVYKITIKICTRFVGRINNPSLLIYQCLVMIEGFQNSLSFIT